MIPRVIHFIWLSCPNPPSSDNLLGIQSALLNTNCKVVLHTNDKTIQIPGIEIREICIPEKINGVDFVPEENLKGYAGNGRRVCHVVDILRLDILYREGGIYSDMDMIWLRNPTEFFEKKVVIGWNNKSYKVLVNSVIMSEPRQEAIQEYKNWLVSIYPPKNYWLPANPYKIWKDRGDVTFAEKYKFNPLKWDKVREITWESVERSICVHLSNSMGAEIKGEVVDSVRNQSK